MSDPVNAVPITVDEYLKREDRASFRNEFVDGYVFAMTGAADAHNVVCGNLFAVVHNRLQDSPCRAYANDMKVKTKSPISFYYPDVMVTCEGFAPKSVFKESPVLIIEVLSPSTRAIDQREKLIAYKKIPSLLEYLIVFSDRQRVELHRRIEGSHWELHTFCAGDSLTLTSLPSGPFEVTLSSVYKGTDAPKRVKEEEAEYSV